MSNVSTAQSERPRIGKYIITGRIGRGGMGMVYRGHDEALDRDVAVKTLSVQPGGSGGGEDDSRARFKIEAKAAAKLQHPNIVTVFELGQDRGIPFIAMELLPGWDLENLLRSEETLLLPEKLDIIIQVCRGLQYAHDHHIVHRDIKPSNIRLLDDGAVKIMDFGIAKLANTHVTKTGMMVGTVHYMCPEQIQGGQVDGRSDVFSVGVILYQLLAGRRPFEGEGATEVLFKIVQDPTPALPDLGKLTPELQKVLERALAKAPADRYPSAARMAEELVELRARVAVHAPPTDVLETIQAARQLLKQGKVDESVTRLREMVQRTPQSVEARRALRAACREAASRQRPAEPEPDFPELTFQVGATRLQQTTILGADSPSAVSKAVNAASGKTLLVAGGAALGLAVLAGLFLLWRSSMTVKKVDGPPASTTAGPGTQSVVENPTQVPVGKDPGAPPGAKAVAVQVVTEPAGATVVLDGETQNGKTPLAVAIDPSRAHQLSVSLEGYAPRRMSLPAGNPQPEIRLPLSLLGPPGSVKLQARYPVDVTLNGRQLVKGEASPTLSLAPGRHTLVISAPAVSLYRNETVDVQSGGTAEVVLPGVGELFVQANPDNCKIFVDGVFVDYPPILKKMVVAGRHTVGFKWTDGGEREETIDVEAGKPVYVTGRKD
jgi:hypothetical protein